VEAVRGQADARVLELRYEELPASAERLAAHLGLDPAPLAEALAAAHTDSVGRWRSELSAEQVAEVEAEAGGLLP
jgi:predicted secreted protein